MKKQTLVVGDFKITAWLDRDGLGRIEIKSKGKDVVAGLGHSGEGGGERGRIMFTNNANIIEAIFGGRRSDDCRSSPAEIRNTFGDARHRASFLDQHNGESPEQWADRIEALRRDEGRDLETGQLLRTAQTSPHSTKIPT